MKLVDTQRGDWIKGINMNLDYRAKLIVHDAAKLTPAEAEEIADWLRELADGFEFHKNPYSGRFTARYMK
jgi:hypothetical protein